MIYIILYRIRGGGKYLYIDSIINTTMSIKGCYYPPFIKHINMENEMDYLVADENCKEALSESNSALPTELIPLI
jgi:hypothetical protein